ncbi:enoyl-CoA hydratase-related protein [Peptococcus simiae]|uniref:enoyl-CoA hydratase-related protein n=1 Tax=Peptococcus simiae TaxID=1643805 RepID=UPI00397F78A9
MEFIKYDVKGRVATLTIDRPKALNALGSQVLNELNQTIDAINTDEVWCLIITGGGEKAFVAGADIAEMKEMTQAQGAEYARKGNDIFRKIEKLPIPVIAAINGFALGGGNELAMSCDIRLCSENAMFGQPEVGLGITPGFGGTQRLARVIGSLSKAKELILVGKNIKADEALAIGLVSAVYPLADLMPAAEKMAGRIAGNAPIAVRHAKEAINRGIQTDIDSGVDIEVDLFGKCFETADQAEGMGAFLEKRKEKTFTNK